MTTYLILYNDPDLLKIKTKDDEIKYLKFKTEKHDYENILKSVKIDNDYYRKKYKSLNKKNVFLTVSEILMSPVGLRVRSGLTVSGLAPVGNLCASSISFLSSIITLITKEYFSKLKIRSTKLRDWINVITLFHEKTLKIYMVDKKLNQKEVEELRKIYNHYLDKRKESMKNTQFRVEDILGDKISKDSLSPEKKLIQKFFS